MTKKRNDDHITKSHDTPEELREPNSLEDITKRLRERLGDRLVEKELQPGEARIVFISHPEQYRRKGEI
jgi:hypothetical protein